MAKKKQDAVEEKIDYVKDIQNKSIQEIAAEEVEIPDEKVDEAIKEVEAERTKVEEKAEDVEVTEDKPLDTSEMEQRIYEKVQKETVDKITKSLKGEDATEEEVSDYKKFANETWKKEGRNPTYEEALEFVSNKAIENIEKRQAEKIQKENEQSEAQKRAEAEREANLNKYIDSELEDLVSSGKLPKVVDKSDENDPGVKARRAVFQAMMEVNTKRASEGKDPIYSPKIVYYEHYKSPIEQPAGADAPISGGRSGVHTDGDNRASYKEIHNKSFLDLMLGR